MLCTQLPSSEFTKFADTLKSECGLVIKEKVAKVILDESKYGKGIDWFKNTYKFYYITKEGKKKFITIQDSKDLVAVTKKQYQMWKKQKIFYLSRLFSIKMWFRQLCWKNNLMDPWC